MGPRMFVFPLWPMGSVSHQKEEDRGKVTVTRLRSILEKVDKQHLMV